ncbi:MAG: type II secretion system protein [Candidatus Woesebacteria bacterium]|nr:type II secretion system protein [Candidatus Woesebacteria bacterium]
MKSTARGFTLIELLIVIAVLGILAVAVLSAINPIEQINRSKDTGSRSDAEQLIGAIDRFYATAGFYPWKTSPILPGVTDLTAWGPVDVTTWSDGTTMVLNKLSAAGTGELKGSFTGRITGGGYNTLRKFNLGLQGDSTYVCFLPKSSSFQASAADRCNGAAGSFGTLPGDFPTDGNAGMPAACPGGYAACLAAKTCMSCLP